MNNINNVSVKQVNFIRSNKVILNNVSLDIQAGQHWALVGLNGSGKSSLVNILSGYNFPSSGHIQVLGQTFGQTSIPELKKRIGLVSNWIHYQLPKQDTVLRIVISGYFASFGIFQPIPQAVEEKAKALLERFHLTSYADRQIGSLSQGEQQMVLILRALMTDPELLILDEPTNSLDLFAKEQLLAFVDSLTSQRNELSLLLITHHLEEITESLSHVALLKDGEIYDKGFRSEMLVEDKLKDFYNHPVKVVPYIGQRKQVIPLL